MTFLFFTKTSSNTAAGAEPGRDPMSCTDEPTILQETWGTIGDAEWSHGGWMINGERYRIVLHITPDAAHEWVTWGEKAPPPPPDYVVCIMTEDDYNLIRRGDLNAAADAIINGDHAYCIAHVDEGGDHYARVIQDNPNNPNDPNTLNDPG
jgi:hypothetical protein